MDVLERNTDSDSEVEGGNLRGENTDSIEGF